jgi:hypothetical protein
MARAIERIERDIEALQEAISALARELEASYTAYLTVLSQALRQQLILASYHLCTQGYPENFLRLSLNQRQKLQQELRKLGTQAGERLLSYTKSEAEAPDTGTDDEVTVVINSETTELPLIENVSLLSNSDPFSFAEISLTDEMSAFEIQELDIEDEDEEDEEDEDDEDEDDEDEDKGEHKEVKNQEESNSASSRMPPFLRISPIIPLRFSAIDPSSPTEVTKWHQSIEMATQYTLKKISREANILLQAATILPKKVPAPILEAATVASEASAEVMPGPPNLVNLVIEIENEQLKHGSKVTQIMAINLRLGEIEFADSMLSSKRNQIRNFLMQLQKLRRDYQKKQREHAIVEAESAWRASWYEES